MKPFILVIAGGTGSGKTTISTRIKDHFDHQVNYIPHDRYYKDQSHLSMPERIKTNYDHPNSLETDLLIKQLKKILAGNSIKMPLYDFKKHTRQKGTILVSPASLILIEGVLIYENKTLRDLINLKIFVDVAADIRVLRKIERDIN